MGLRRARDPHGPGGAARRGDRHSEQASARDERRRLLSAADVVVEASRPRALRQLGIEAEALLAERPGRVWISLTGYGRGEPEAGWVAFGDDAAVAGGLADRAGDAAGPLFCGDAVADPLAGLEAADQALAALERGGGCRIDVNLADAARREKRRRARRRARAPPSARSSRLFSGRQGWRMAVRPCPGHRPWRSSPTCARARRLQWRDTGARPLRRASEGSPLPRGRPMLHPIGAGLWREEADL